MKILASLVIVHWNNGALLKNLLTKLGTHPELEVIVVDNNSDEKPTWINKSFPHVRLIQNTSNLGYATACNRGATGAQGEWLIFLNDDLEITHAKIKEMITFLSNNSLSVGSPLPESDAYRKPVPSALSLLAEFTPLKHVISLEKFTDKTLFGGCVLIKRNVFDMVGGWSEDFFVWFEDSDLTVRLSKAGYIIGWIPVHINHKGGASFARLTDETKKMYFFTSMDMFAKKHLSFVGRFVVKMLKLRYVKKI